MSSTMLPKEGLSDPAQRVCFTAGTLVKTPDGSKKIEDIKPGDMVLSFDESSNELKYMRVQQKFVRTAHSIYHIKYADGEELETTWSHRFNIAGKGWVEAKDLRAGMKSPTAMSMSVFHAQLQANGGMSLKIQSASYTGNKAMAEDDGIEIVVPENLPYMNEISGIYVEQRTDTVYNFSVEGGHTYFVSEDGDSWVWVHNDRYQLTYDSSGKLVSATTTFMGKEYSLNDGIKVEEVDGKRVITLTDEHGNKIKSVIDGDPNIPYSGGGTITTDYRPNDVKINDIDLFDGGIVKMGSDGHLTVTGISGVDRGAIVQVNGIDNDALDALTGLNETKRRNASIKEAYMIYNRNKSIDDLNAYANDRSVPNAAQDTLTNLLMQQDGQISYLVGHSMGGMISSRAIDKAMGAKKNLSKMTWITAGGVQQISDLPKYRNSDRTLNAYQPKKSIFIYNKDDAAVFGNNINPVLRWNQKIESLTLEQEVNINRSAKYKYIPTNSSCSDLAKHNYTGCYADTAAKYVNK